MSVIVDINATTIKDSLDNLTVEATITTDDGILVVDSVPTGVSRGGAEAALVPATTAAELVNSTIKPKLIGLDVNDQARVDKMMIQLDGTPTKERLGANSLLAVSLACARAAAKSQRIPLYRYLANQAKIVPKLPLPLMVIIEGGKHGFGNPLTYQEFLVGCSVQDGLAIIERVKERFSQENIRWNNGSEGGLAPFLPSNEAALELLSSVKGKAMLGLDIAASHIRSTGLDLIKMAEKYQLKFLEDPFPESDWTAWSSFTKAIGEKALVVGDDLTTTNIERVAKAIKTRAVNAMIIKPNQIGTLTETLLVARRAKEVGWDLVVSHRAGETLDDFIADLAVGLGATYLKSGAPTQKERLAKYERLDGIAQEFR